MPAPPACAAGPFSPTAVRRLPRIASSPRSIRNRAGSSTTPRRSGRLLDSTLNEVVDRVGRDVGRRDRHRQPARDRRRLEPADGQAVRHGNRVAGPAHRRSLRGAARCRPSPACARDHRLVLDPYFSASKFEWLLTERDIPVDDRSGARHDRLVADLEPHRRSRSCHRPDQRQQNDAVRHPVAAVVRRAVRPVRRADVGAAFGAAVERPVR